MADFAKQVNVYQPSGNPTVPQVKKFSLTFTTEQQSISLMTGAQNTGNTLSPQTAIVDNTTNAFNVILTVNGINYPVPAGACFTFPLVSFDDPDITVVSAGAGNCVVTLSNQRMPGSMLGNTAAVETVSITGALPAGNNIIGTVIVQPFQGPLTDYSGTIAAEFTNYVIAPANSLRRYLFMANDGGGNLYINFGTPATYSSANFVLEPGATLIMDNSYVNTESINILGSAANILYTCKTA